MDTFVEQIIVRKKTPQQVMLAIMIMMLTSFLVVFTWVRLGPVALIVIAALGYGMWWLLSGMNIEYE